MTKLSDSSRDSLIKRFMPRKQEEAGAGAMSSCAAVPESMCRFDSFPAYQKLLAPRMAAQKLGVEDPFFKTHEGRAGATTVMEGQTRLNFSSYNYLGLSGDSRVSAAAKEAIDQYGTSASASRLVAGERPVQRALEKELARFYGCEDAVVFVSGHATNVTTIGTLFGPKDLILHDSLIHNSILDGIRLSGATRRSFAHNDPEALDEILSDIRGRFERTLIVIEGLYSMDGDVPDLPRFIALKKKHKAFLMVDEAHSVGVLGETGRGIREVFGLQGTAVDIWMGTLSKALASCGGYICGEKALIDHLKYGASGFVYSVGLAPPLAAAALEALRILQKEPERVAWLRERAAFFLQKAQAHRLDTGFSEGHAVVPIIMGSSLKAVKISAALYLKGVNVQPIIHPAVEERAARLRFFLSCEHTEAQIIQTIETLSHLV